MISALYGIAIDVSSSEPLIDHVIIEMENESNWNLNTTINSGEIANIRFGGSDLIDIDGDGKTDFVCNDYFWGDSKNGSVCVSFGKNHIFRDIRNTSIDDIYDLVFIGNDNDELMYRIRDINSDGKSDLQLRVGNETWIFYSSTLAKLSGEIIIDMISPDIKFYSEDVKGCFLYDMFDINGDEFNDFMFCDTYGEGFPVIYGREKLPKEININASEDIRIISPSDWHWAYMDDCDFNGDGIRDFIFHYLKFGDNNRWDPTDIKFQVVFGNSTMWKENIHIEKMSNLTIEGSAYYDAHRDVVVEDIDGDGKDDFAFYNAEKDDVSVYRNYWYIINGCDLTGCYRFEDLVSLRLTSIEHENGISRSISFCDLNDDGRKDILVSGKVADQKGAVMLILGREGLFKGNDVKFHNINYTMEIRGSHRFGESWPPNYGSGYHIDSVSDVDADGVEDIIIGANLDINETLTDRGGCVILYGNRLLQREDISTMFSNAEYNLSLPYPNGPYWNDTDDDGIRNLLDSFPDNPTEWNDNDGDGYGDNRDKFPDDPDRWNGTDSDGDGYGDEIDDFPGDSSEWIDTDGDGHGDNQDVFPHNSSEWSDIDLDGVGDNIDQYPNDPLEWKDTDEDGYPDNSDAFPINPDEWADTDGDEVGDNADAFPEDPAASIDSDKDGYPDKWNDGKDEKDTTTGLILDEYPNDPDSWEEKPDCCGGSSIIVLVSIILIIIIFGIIAYFIYIKRLKTETNRLPNTAGRGKMGKLSEV